MFVTHSFPLWINCGRDEDVQGVLTLFKEQLEVEEEDGDRQEEKVEEKGEVESRRVRHG